MKRRDFLKRSVVAGTAMTLSFDQLHAALTSNTMVVETAPDLVAVMGGEPEDMLDKALEALGGIGQYVKKGQKVVIKPNIGWDRAPEMGANTNPKLVKALIQKCLEAGAQKVTVFDHTCDNWQKCYQNSGIEAAAKEAGAVVVPANEDRYYKDSISLPNGKKLKSAKIHEALVEADVWFNVPVLKHHGGAKLSCSMKNLMGIVQDRRFFHSNDLQQCIADISSLVKKPALNIVDAYRILFQNGPQGRSASDVALVKSLIASPNMVSADAAAVTFFNQVKSLDLNAASHVLKGEELNLGTTDLAKLNIKRIRM